VGYKKYLFDTKKPMVHKNRAEDVELLIQKFSFFGIEGQIWMLLVAFLIAAFVVVSWRMRGF
jgi:hypothetical protein